MICPLFPGIVGIYDAFIIRSIQVMVQGLCFIRIMFHIRIILHGIENTLRQAVRKIKGYDKRLMNGRT